MTGTIYNQRMSGLINAHLTFGPGISSLSKVYQILPCLKIGKSQPRVIIYANYVEQDYQISGSEEDFKGFYHIWGWWPSWSCEFEILYKLLFSPSK